MQGNPEGEAIAMNNVQAASVQPSGELAAGNSVSGLLSFLIDPQGAARQVFRKWFWVTPWILLAVVSLVTSFFILPVMQHVLETAPPPPGQDAAAYEAGKPMILKFTTVLSYLAPVTTLILFCVQAGLMFGVASVMSIPGKFTNFLNVVAGCSIIQVLATIATAIILKSKTEFGSLAEMRPALGLDIFMPEGANKVLTAFLGYFSIFEIWWIVMAMLVISVAFRVSKGKALAVVSPIILLSLAFRVVGAAFSKG